MPVKKKMGKEKRLQKEQNDVELTGTDVDQIAAQQSGDSGEETESGGDNQKNEAEPSTEELLERLSKAENERAEFQDRLLRTLAEFDNYKKRVSREKENLVKYGTEKLALELLQIVDNFERAFEQAQEAREIKPVIAGIEMIIKQFNDVFTKFHITVFDSIGTAFDPEKHEAMAQQEHAEHEENTILSEFQKGYYLKGRLLRPARVIVSKKPVDQNEEGRKSESDEPEQNEE